MTVKRKSARTEPERAAQSRDHIFAALSATNEAILHSSTAEEMLQKVADAAVGGGKFLGAAIFRKEKHSPLLRMDSGAGTFVHLIAKMHLTTDPSLPHGQGLGGTAFRSNEPCTSHDVTTDPRTRPWWAVAKKAGVKACAALPIRSGGAPVGVIYFFLGREHGALTDEIADLMDRMAENVSFGLRMFERQDERRLALKEQENLHRMYVALTSTNEAIMRSRTRDELFQLVCSAAVLGGKFTSTTIALSEPGEEFLRIAASKGQNADRVKSTRFAVDAKHPEGRGLTGTSFRTRAPCIMNDFLTDERTRHWHTLARVGGTRSGASFPLLKGKEPIGILLFLSSEKDIFTDDLVDLLARLAENISFALGNFDREAEQKQAEQKIQYLATHDSLTGLPNRAMFDELLNISMASARRNDRKCAVLFIDLDGFKIVNDSMGHAAGDALLIEVAQRLRNCIRKSDIVVRLGGDEFIIILNDTEDREQIAVVASKVVESVTGIAMAGAQYQTTASIGIAIFPDDGSDVETLTKNADTVMYLVKKDGKNDFRFFEQEMDPWTGALQNPAQEMRHALASCEFEVHYQLVVSIETGRKLGAEALVRWRHPTHGLMSPDKFIPLAEETGLIHALGELVLQVACRDAVKWPSHTNVAVNLSPVQFQNPDLAKKIASILVTSGLPPQRLVLEITESVLLRSTDRNISILHELRSLGVSIALDDFGTGHSSLSYLRMFPFDNIKIDRSFVSEVTQMDTCAAIVCAIANLGRSLDIVTTAEGVETEEQLELLRAAGCTQVQGYLFGRPCSVANLDFHTDADWSPPKRRAGLTPGDIMLVRSSFTRIGPVQDAVADLFYDRLFATAPELRRLFPHDMNEQKRKLMALLATCVGRLQSFSTLEPIIKKLGERHVGYGAKSEHYTIVAEALLWALGEALGDAFTQETRFAWVKVYNVLAATMQSVAKESPAIRAAS
jgi:diguanylate cyclase (GGDEF)-like protein